MLKKIVASVIASVVVFCFIGSTKSFADIGGKHPAYLHALSDLRFARAHLEKMTVSDRLNDQEMRAIDEINKAIGEIKRAAIDDGKDLNDHPAIDTNLNRTGRYHRVLEVLRKVRKDIGSEEDNGEVRGLRRRAYKHIDIAINIVKMLIERR
jgi:hypothetical protein